MGPVFLFYMGVIVFVIGPVSGEVDGVFSVGEVSQEVIVEEFRAVIAIKAEQGEGRGLFDVLDFFQDNGIGEHTGYGFTAVGHGIGL